MKAQKTLVLMKSRYILLGYQCLLSREGRGGVSLLQQNKNGLSLDLATQNSLALYEPPKQKLLTFHWPFFYSAGTVIEEFDFVRLESPRTLNQPETQPRPSLPTSANTQISLFYEGGLFLRVGHI